MLLQGKIAIVTGAASPRGIGRATAQAFAEQGARVIIIDLDLTAAREAAAQLGEGHLGLAANVADEAQVRDAVAQALGHYGRIDVLVNNAGITQPVKTLEITGKDYDRILDVNLRGTLLMSQAVLPAMRSQKAGSIICMSSVSAQRGGGIFGGPHYSAAKAGVLGLAKAMAREFGADNVRVNSLTPGLIQTDITGGLMHDERRHAIIDGIPLGRLGDARDVANAALFLASDLSSYLTGITLDVNGGMLIH
ncbi:MULTISPECIES: SDR family NAD(P)-dependent oxidoreductase [unclassified Pseudomonas]|jgi:NAD(P)-dependent dehydrogenase (short-subunit alcohol dehydrogenase family)|uniref:SDR family NAD(P)-dependent oxidoreductase n=1 Tax=unclassified Pseudomonas TaxID=196821 RepID=UPI000483125B|nr:MULTISPECIES: SDR family NAD(P)-dependent oxidoreductase [unclassified Pseudomonas]MBV7561432.1 SDR family oxidoreductase [Pseudomonas sp. sia0905]PZW63875.1 NAD(P)-dependent dehydrogenase (short-subunit alcohol dehydrogenase family) [Pseudomonas sp. URMO17WK12:I1]